MAKRIQYRGGTTAQHVAFTGAEREISVDTTKDTLVVHDGMTPGGHPLAKEAALNTVAATVSQHTTDINNLNANASLAMLHALASSF
jgi:hypothetical protein